MNDPKEFFFFVQLSPADAWRQWYVYTLRPKDDAHKILFVGWCDARELLTLSHARQNTAYQKYVAANPDAVFHLVAESKHPTKEAAQHAGARLSHQLKPEFNFSGITIARKRSVRCLDNDMVFNSVTEAARYVGCASPSMSSHLSRRPGYATIRGLTFERVE